VEELSLKGVCKEVSDHFFCWAILDGEIVYVDAYSNMKFLTGASLVPPSPKRRNESSLDRCSKTYICYILLVCIQYTVYESCSYVDEETEALLFQHILLLHTFGFHFKINTCCMRFEVLSID